MLAHEAREVHQGIASMITVEGLSATRCLAEVVLMMLTGGRCRDAIDGG